MYECWAELLKDRVGRVDVALTTVPWHELCWPLDVDNGTAERRVEVWHSGLAWHKVADVGELEDGALKRVVIAGNVLAVLGGADIVRVHDVAETVQALRVTAAIEDLQ